MSESDINFVVLLGRLSFDGDQRVTATGKPVCSLKMTTGSGKYREGHRLTFWGDMPPGMTKGARVRAEGRLTTRTWTNKEGQEVATIEVVCELLRAVADHEAPLPAEVRALAAGVAPGLAANLPAVEPGELPTLLPPYGRDRGKPIAGATAEQLDFYAAGAKRNLEDPGKARWRAKDQALLTAIAAERDRQKTGRHDPMWSAPAADPFEDDPIPF